MNDRDRAAGRGGMGAIMGAKNLKAVAASGDRPVSVSDPEGYKALTSRLDRIIDKNPVTGKSLQVLGTSVLVNIINAHGMFPTENFRRGVFNDAEGTSGEKIAETLLVRQSACYKCPIGCGRTTRTKTSTARVRVRDGLGVRRPSRDQRPGRHHRGQLRLQRAGPRYHHHGQHPRLRHGVVRNRGLEGESPLGRRRPSPGMGDGHGLPARDRRGAGPGFETAGGEVRPPGPRHAGQRHGDPGV